MDDTPIGPSPASAAHSTAIPRAWLTACVTAVILLSALGWLLARLIWLPYYFGLFFYLVGGLLVGATAFRIGRPARPLAKATLVRGVVAVALVSVCISVLWEYAHFVATVGDPPRFAAARNAAVAAGRPPQEVEAAAARAFKEYLRTMHPPGGVVGYVRWSIESGEATLTVAGAGATLTTDHRGFIWPLRTLVAVLLVAGGLWSATESLRSAEPVTNILGPGEEIVEEI